MEPEMLQSQKLFHFRGSRVLIHTFMMMKIIKVIKKFVSQPKMYDMRALKVRVNVKSSEVVVVV